MPSHYLNQCWFIANQILRNNIQWNFNRKLNIFIQENAFQNVVCKMVTILSWPQCVNWKSSSYEIIIHGEWAIGVVNTLRPRQDGRHFPDDILKCIFLNENIWILRTISLKRVWKAGINNIPSLVQIMAWRRHICVTRPQWVKESPHGTTVAFKNRLHESWNLLLNRFMDVGCTRFYHLGKKHSALTHWGQDKMDAILQTFLNAFYWMKTFDFWIKFHWNMFLGA